MVRSYWCLSSATSPVNFPWSGRRTRHQRTAPTPSEFNAGVADYQGNYLFTYGIFFFGSHAGEIHLDFSVCCPEGHANLSRRSTQLHPLSSLSLSLPDTVLLVHVGNPPKQHNCSHVDLLTSGYLIRLSTVERSFQHNSFKLHSSQIVFTSWLNFFPDKL